MAGMVGIAVRQDLRGRGEGLREARLRRNIQPYYWHLWAIKRAGSMTRLGYPSQVPFYQPARLGNVEIVEGDRPWSPPSVDDWRKVERLDIAVSQHRLVRPREVWCLEIWEGAYQDSPIAVEDRCRDHGLTTATCRRMANRARRAIDEAVGVLDAAY